MAVHASDRLETRVDHRRVVRVPTGQRRVRVTVLLDGRSPGLRRPIGRHLRHRVLVRRARVGRPVFRGVTPRRAPYAVGRFRRVHGLLPTRNRRVHENV